VTARQFQKAVIVFGVRLLLARSYVCYPFLINAMTLPPPECKVYTPPQLADAMVGSIDPQDDDF
jgi:hypothetical protein